MKLIDLENLQLYDEEIKKYLKQKVNDITSIVQTDSYISFPLTGDEKVLYIDTTTNYIYRWSDEETKYYQVSSDWNDITMIDGNF